MASQLSDCTFVGTQKNPVQFQAAAVRSVLPPAIRRELIAADPNRMAVIITLVFAVMAYGALGSANTVSDIKLGVKYCRTSSCGGIHNGRTKYTRFLKSGGGWSGWSGRQNNGHWRAFKVGIFTKNGELAETVSIKDVDFRFAIEVDNNDNHNHKWRKYTKWASEGGGWSGWASPHGNHNDIRWMRVRLQVRNDPGLVIRNARIGAWASTAAYNAAHNDGAKRTSSWLQGTSGGWTAWATGSGGAGMEYAAIRLQTIFVYDASNAFPAIVAEKQAMNSDLDVVEEPSNGLNPTAFTALIGTAVLAIVAVLFVVLRRWMKRKQSAKESVTEMSEVADTPNVVHVAEETVEAVTTGTTPETATEIVATETVVEVVVEEEAVEMGVVDVL